MKAAGSLSMTKNLVEDKKINNFFNHLFEAFAGRSLPTPALKEQADYLLNL